MKRVYLAGPMTGIPYRNYPAFDEVEAFLETTWDWEVISPVQMNRDCFPGIEQEPGHATGANDATEQARRGLVMTMDLHALMECDYLALLPGWESSEGACMERRVAEATGMKIWLVKRTGIDAYDKWMCEPDPIQMRLSVPVHGSRVILDEAFHTFERKPVQFHCMPPHGLQQLGIVSGMGADKHGSNSYRDGNPPTASYHIDAIFRHLFEYMEGYNEDEESGVSPLAHVAWRALAIIQGHKDLGASFDDRWNSGN